jgi:hypothetical protein
MTSKTFNGYLIINYKTGAVMVRKSYKNYSTGPNIPVKYKITLELPEIKPETIEKTIVIDQHKACDIVLEGL